MEGFLFLSTEFVARITTVAMRAIELRKVSTNALVASTFLIVHRRVCHLALTTPFTKYDVSSTIVVITIAAICVDLQRLLLQRHFILFKSGCTL